MSVAVYVTLGNSSGNLCRTKLRDKLQEKLPSVTAPLIALISFTVKFYFLFRVNFIYPKLVYH